MDTLQKSPPTQRPEGSADGQAMVETERTLLAEAAHEMICRLDAGLAILYASPATRRVTGYAPEHLVGARLDDFGHPDDLAALLSSFALAQESGDEASTMFRFRTAEGGWRWCEAFLGVAEDGIRATIRDVEKYKRIEKAIERVAREWRTTFDAAHDAILMLDREGRVVRVNRSTLEIFDCEFQDLVGNPLNRLVNERLKLDDPFGLTEVWQQQQQVRRDVELEARSIWLRSTLDPIMMADGEFSGAVLFLANITAEKQAEIKLRRSLDEVRQLSIRLQDYREQERRSIARELHDELGHALTALKMDIAWLSKRLPETDDAALERGREVAASVDRTVAATRRIVSRLRPPILDDLGLDAALEWLLADFQRHSGLKVDADIESMPERLRGETATALFHVVQEALTNVSRHADASSVKVSWDPADETMWRLRVEDDGKGFDRHDEDGRARFGLIGISERVHAFGGEFEIESRPDRGTRLEVLVPSEALQ